MPKRIDLASLKDIPGRRVKGIYYRFHAQKYFNSDPKCFYKNFLETRRTFEQQCRFAGKRRLSGFYFASSEAVAKVESIFYGECLPMKGCSASSILDHYRRTKTPKVLLRVQLDLSNMCDLTQPWVVRRVLREGNSRVKSELRPMASWFRYVLSDNRGGDDHTNGLGTDAWELGFRGVVFPSIRMAQMGDAIGTSGGY